jgi:hypothetical protein
MTTIHLLDPATAAAIRADNERYMARLRPLFAAYKHDGFGFDVRHKGGHITLLSERDADELAALMRATTWDVEVKHFDVSDDDDFDHDHEWVLIFKVDGAAA